MSQPELPPRSRVGDAVKRSIDVIVALVGVVLLLPVFAAVALAIKLDTPGPPIYRARRTGRRGVPFDMFKFRTMYVGAVAPRKGLTTGLNDPRVTPLGRILRSWKIDELPQLTNILRGEMSLVGPRPEMPYYTDQYVGDELLILTVRPGITDFSSVYFYNLQEVVGSGDADEAFEQHVLPTKNRLRVQYVRERSFLVDMSLLFKTALILSRRAFSRRKAKPSSAGTHPPLVGQVGQVGQASSTSTITPNSSQPRDRHTSGATGRI